MSRFNFKKGDPIVNNGGSYAIVLAVKSNLVIATDWCDTLEKAKTLTLGNTRFGERAVDVLGINVLRDKNATATVSGDEKPLSKAEKAKLEKEAFEARVEEAKSRGMGILVMTKELLKEWLKIAPELAEGEDALKVGDEIEYTLEPTEADLQNAKEAFAKQELEKAQ